MALNTRSNRLSILDFYSPSAVALPDPDGSFDAADRQQIAGGYRDITWSFTSPGIGKGNIITAYDVVTFNTAFENEIVNTAIKAETVFNTKSKEFNNTYTQWIRNNLPGNLYLRLLLSATSSLSGVTCRARIVVKDSTGTVVFDLNKDKNFGEHIESLQLDEGFYTIEVTSRVAVSGIAGVSEVEIDIIAKPSDVTINGGNIDKVRIYTSDFSALAEPQLATAVLAEQGLFTTENGTDEAHGGT